MPEKSAKRMKIEASLADDPNDSFLRYGLAVQCLRDGDTDEGRRLLRELLADRPDDVAAWQQLGQSYIDTDEFDLARMALKEGVMRAGMAGDAHAQGEMRGLLDQIEDLI